MTLEKAIEELTIEREVATRTGRRSLYDALGIAIEALKSVKQDRALKLSGRLQPLPGETEE